MEIDRSELMQQWICYSSFRHDEKRRVMKSYTNQIEQLWELEFFNWHDLLERAAGSNWNNDEGDDCVSWSWECFYLNWHASHGRNDWEVRSHLRCPEFQWYRKVLRSCCNHCKICIHLTPTHFTCWISFPDHRPRRLDGTFPIFHNIISYFEVVCAALDRKISFRIAMPTKHHSRILENNENRSDNHHRARREKWEVARKLWKLSTVAFFHLLFILQKWKKISAAMNNFSS